ncbi:hypothetical protein [Phenylobacterium sp.]|uniref:COG4223 family protein n=1 Tax=Phenylobacterium sp. TaxID=1871053 RepID=UPI0028120528|nr:hypothetical protein [Phenylobacterium sp.]
MNLRADPALPKDPAEYRRRPLGLGLWSLLALCALCLLVGVGAGVLAPRILAEPPAPAGMPASTEVPTSVAAAPPELERAEPAEIQRLNARIAALESEGARTSEAAAAALAAAALVEASQGSEPFAVELAALRAASPDLPELAALARVAQQGAPSRAQLAAEFPRYAARAASAARTPGPDAKLGDRIVYVLSRVVSVRQVSDTQGPGADAVLARAEQALQQGDVVGALKALDALPPNARDSMAPWRAEAERRAHIDRQAVRLRTRAVRDLQAAGIASEGAA